MKHVLSRFTEPIGAKTNMSNNSNTQFERRDGGEWGKLHPNSPYREAFGSLLWLASCPNISFAVSTITKYLV